MRRRGISPVIAVLLLIVIAVAAAILTYVWLTGYLTSQFGSVQTTQLGEQLKIEAAKLDTGGSYEAYVRNVGDTDVTIDTVYLLASDGSPLAVDDDPSVESSPITPGSVTKVSGSFSDADITAGKTYFLKIVTSTGTEVSVEVKAKAAAGGG